MLDHLASTSSDSAVRKPPVVFDAYYGGLPVDFDASQFLVICTPIANIESESTVTTLPASKKDKVTGKYVPDPNGTATTGLTPQIIPARLANGKRLHIDVGKRWFTLRIGS